MARSFNGSSQVITMPVSTSSAMFFHALVSISVWFKTTDAGTVRRVIYNEGASGNSTENLYIAINDGVNGQISVYKQDGSSNSYELTHSGGYADGEWHLLTFSSFDTATHTLMIDGAVVDTSIENVSSIIEAGVNHSRFGSRFIGSTASGFWVGQISDCVIYNQETSLAEHIQLFEMSKHACNLKPLSQIKAYYPLHTTRNNFDIINHAQQDFGSYTIFGATNVDGPDGPGPTGMVVTTDISQAYVFTTMANSPIITRGSTAGAADRLLFEIGNVVYDPTDETYPFKLYYSGSPDPYDGANCSTFVATASNVNGPWTKQGAIITNATLPTEDSFVYRDPDTGIYHLVAENKTGGSNANGICHFTSSNGLIFTRQDSNGSPWFDAGSGWEATDVSSPILWKENSTWYLLYEGRTGADGSIGLATAPDINGPWTREASNPVMAPSSGWEAGSVVCDALVKIGSTYWMGYHASPSGISDWRQGLAYSTDLINWTKFELNPVGTTGIAQGINRLGGTEFGKLYSTTSITGSDDINIITMYGDPAVQTGDWPSAVAVSSSGLISQRSVGVRN